MNNRVWGETSMPSVGGVRGAVSVWNYSTTRWEMLWHSFFECLETMAGGKVSSPFVGERIATTITQPAGWASSWGFTELDGAPPSASGTEGLAVM